MNSKMFSKPSEILTSWPIWPNFGPREQEAVARVIRSNQLFAAGEVSMFERDFSNYLECSFSIGVGNATQGLHLALSAAEIGEGDEVIVTACSWISTASCILMQNAIPVFVDIESETLGIDPDLVEKAITSKTRAIIVVHILGYPAQITRLTEIAKKHNLILIEDASHAPGATVDGKKLGTFGDIGVFSLHQRKAISTGDGGIICTNNELLASKIRKRRSFGDDELSYNYRMTEFSAALGRLALERLDEDNKKRVWAAEYLSELFIDKSWIKARLVKSPNVGVYYAVALEVNLSDGSAIQLLNHFVNLGVPMRKLFDPLNRHPHFRNVPKSPRGLPWRHPNYKGDMRDIVYGDLDLPTAYEYCYGRILEIYVHPGVMERHLQAFANELELQYEIHDWQTKRRDQ